jgi:hypothetical protein
MSKEKQTRKKLDLATLSFYVVATIFLSLALFDLSVKLMNHSH